MKVIIIGATGTLGTEVVKLLSGRHKLIKTALKKGDFQADMTSKESIRKLYQEVGSFDAVICTAGFAPFGKMETFSDSDYMAGLTNKLMGQVNLVREGIDRINDNGSFCLTSGMLSLNPIPGCTSISMVNAGVEGFVRAAALEMKRGVRLNAVSPVFARETAAAMKLDEKKLPGVMPASRIALAYREAIEGNRNGEILDTRNFG